MVIIDNLEKNEANTIKSSELLKNLTDEQANRAMELFDAEILTYNKGEIIHHSYSEIKKFGLVVSGIVQACMDDIDGNRIIMADVSAGETFGESLCFLEVKDSPVFIYACEKSEIIWLSVKTLFASNTDEFCAVLQKKFISMLARRTLAMNNRIQVLSKIKLRDKLITYFKIQSDAAGSRTFQISINRDDLASYIGTNRSALSRELSQMKKDGLIDYYKNSFRLI